MAHVCVYLRLRRGIEIDRPAWKDMSICCSCGSFGFGAAAAPPKFIGIIGAAPPPKLAGGNPKPRPRSLLFLLLLLLVALVPKEKELVGLKVVGAVDAKIFVFELSAAKGLLEAAGGGLLMELGPKMKGLGALVLVLVLVLVLLPLLLLLVVSLIGSPNPKLRFPSADPKLNALLAGAGGALLSKLKADAAGRPPAGGPKGPCDDSDALNESKADGLKLGFTAAPDPAPKLNAGSLSLGLNPLKPNDGFFASGPISSSSSAGSGFLAAGVVEPKENPNGEAGALKGGASGFKDSFFTSSDPALAAPKLKLENGVKLGFAASPASASFFGMGSASAAARFPPKLPKLNAGDDGGFSSAKLP